MPLIDETHEPSVRSWVASANSHSDFPIQNLPFGVFRQNGSAPRGGVAIGDQILDLSAALAAELFKGEAIEAAKAASGPAINPLFEFPSSATSALRRQLFEILREGSPHAGKPFLVAQSAVEMMLPLEVRGFTDFACSFDHTYRMVQGNMPPSFASVPMAYNGRASSVVTNCAFRRPFGQWLDADGAIVAGPEPSMDFELEMGGIVRRGNAFGEPMCVSDAADAFFGFVLLNDWSARGIQILEMTPLGPFLGKSVATGISPWIVTAEALAPFRIAARSHMPDAPPPPAYLADEEDAATGSFNIELQATISTEKMRQSGEDPVVVVETNSRVFYWTYAQMLAHHSSNGCNMQPGDLLGSGTISGPLDKSRACLGEVTMMGRDPWTLPNGETRTFLEDGDEITLLGTAVAEGYVPIGFGTCWGRILPFR